MNTPTTDPLPVGQSVAITAARLLLLEPAAGLQVQICTPASGQARFRQTGQTFHARNLLGEELYAVARVSAQAPGRFLG